MSELTIVSNQTVLNNKFNIYGTFEEPLMLAKDVAKWIGHTNITHMMNIVDEEEKLTYTIRNSGQNREMWFLTENGVYEVLMQSRKPIAKAFKAEVKKIIKELRKTGKYSPTNSEPTAFETLIAESTNRKYQPNTYSPSELAHCFGVSSKVINHILLSSEVVQLGGYVNDEGNRVFLDKKNRLFRYDVGEKYKKEQLVRRKAHATNVEVRLTLKGALFIYDVMTAMGYDELTFTEDSARYTISKIASELGMTARTLNSELLRLGFYKKDAKGKRVLSDKYANLGLINSHLVTPIGRKEIISLITEGVPTINQAEGLRVMYSGKFLPVKEHPRIKIMQDNNPTLALPSR